MPREQRKTLAQKMGRFLSSGVEAEELGSDESLGSMSDDSFGSRPSSMERQARAAVRSHQPERVYAPAAQAAAPAPAADAPSAEDTELKQQAIKEVEVFA